MQRLKISCSYIVLTSMFFLFLPTLLAQPTKRCGTERHKTKHQFKIPSDCGSHETVIRSEYDPKEILTIRVVIHNIHKTDGTGRLDEAVIHQQMQILNEDFGATAGTVGEAGTDSGIRFVLAGEAPDGTPTNGINYVENDAWFKGELEDYGPPLHWDPTRYLNFYIADSEDYAGVVYQLPWEPDPVPGWEGFVVVYQAIGPSDFYDGPNHTATHEAGHYLGLEHTFNNNEGDTCPSGDCYKTGDFICDTNPHTLAENPTCTERQPCEGSEPIHNYMNYTSNRCMNRFTPEQINRMRCSILNYRQGILTEAVAPEETLAKRWIPHLTREDGGFETEIFLSNTTDQTQQVILKGYDQKGESTEEKAFTLEAGQRQVLSQSQAFSITQPSHAAILGSDKVIVSFGYRFADQTGVSAHLAEQRSSHQSFLLHLGESGLVFDGLAMLNLGKAPAQIFVEILEADGTLTHKTALAEQLPIGGKALADLSALLPVSAKGMVKLSSDQPLIVLGLRGSKPGNELPFLFYNPMIPIP